MREVIASLSRSTAPRLTVGYENATEDQLRRIVRYNVPELLQQAHVAGSRKLKKSPFWYHSD